MENLVHECFHGFEIKVEKDEVNEPVHEIDHTCKIKVEKNEMDENNFGLLAQTKMFDSRKLSQEINSLIYNKNLRDLKNENIKLEWSESLPDLNSLHTEIKIEQDEIDEYYSTDLTENKIVCVGKKLFQCDTCNKTFHNSGNLSKHKRIHSGQKPYECNICTKTFTTLNNLKIHERVHSGEKPYKCNICAKTFNQSSALKRHEKIHSAERPYQCNMCSKIFNQLNHLKAHQRIHME